MPSKFSDNDSDARVLDDIRRLLLIIAEASIDSTNTYSGRQLTEFKHERMEYSPDAEE